MNKWTMGDGINIRSGEYKDKLWIEPAQKLKSKILTVHVNTDMGGTGYIRCQKKILKTMVNI